MSGFSLGLRSRMNLRGVRPELVRVVERAIQLTSVDFTVVEGSRSRERQKELVRSGASRTMSSKHLDGRAVDLAPYVGGRIRWDWPLFFVLAPAMIEAARELHTAITWGAVWDRDARDLDMHMLEDEVRLYQQRRGKGAFIDGPHWELRT